MKKTILTAAGFAMASASTMIFAADATYVSGTYQIDSTHSKVGFEIPHLVISSVEGRFNAYKGDIVLGKTIDKSTVRAEVELASIDTGVKDRDSHLKSADFFDVAKHPKMTFKSKRVEGSADDLKLIGDLTIKGVTKEVIFNAKYLGAVVDGYGNQKVAFDASTRVNRRDFGLTWGKLVEAGPVVGDEVTITLKIQGAKPAQKHASAQ